MTTSQFYLLILISSAVILPRKVHGQSPAEAVTFLYADKYPITSYYFDEFDHPHTFNLQKKVSDSLVVLSVPLSAPTQFRFPDGPFQYPVYVKPGDSIRLKAHYNHFPGIIFSGKFPAELNCLTWLETNSKGVSFLDLMGIAWHDKINSKAVLEEHDRLYQVRLAALDKYNDSLSLRPSYYELVRNEIELIHILGLLQLFFNSSDEQRAKLPADYYARLDGYKKRFQSDTSWMHCHFYRFAITSYSLYLNRAYSKSPISLKQLYLSAKSDYAKPISYFLQFHTLHNELENRTAEFFACLTDFQNTCPVKSYVDHLTNEIKAYSILTDDAALLAEELIDVDGKSHKWATILKKNSGKVIFLDFWASWCAPCRVEIPHSIRLQKDFHKATHSFIYISIDENIDKWKKALKDTRLYDSDKGYSW